MINSNLKSNSFVQLLVLLEIDERRIADIRYMVSEVVLLLHGVRSCFTITWCQKSFYCYMVSKVVLLYTVSEVVFL